MNGRHTYMAGRDVMPARVSLAKGEILDITVIVLPGTDCRLSVTVDIDGEGAELRLRGLYLCAESERVDINVNVRHNVGHTCSRQLFKGIVGGRAKVSFEGLVHVCQDAQKIKAYQENRNILLSDEATVDTAPQLEIYADDVECSHGATVGRLDEGELFYMRSRGISEEEARKMQMVSFISPVLDGLEARDREKVLEALACL